MTTFKKSVSVSGKYPKLMIRNGQFVDPDSGEIISLITELQSVYGDETFSLSTSYKADEEVKDVM